ncbi:MAG: hypothetical protein ACJ71B_05715 [Nitrososphaera sp.]
MASAKNPSKRGSSSTFVLPLSTRCRLWRTTFHTSGLTLPDGSETFSDDGEIDQTLSKVFGREVSVIKASLTSPSYEEYWPDIEGLAQREIVTDEAMHPQTFFDVAVIHLLTTSTIGRLRELYPEGRFQIRRFRPNVVVESESEEKDFIENSWVDKKLTIG